MGQQTGRETVPPGMNSQGRPVDRMSQPGKLSAPVYLRLLVTSMASVGFGSSAAESARRRGSGLPDREDGNGLASASILLVGTCDALIRPVI